MSTSIFLLLRAKNAVFKVGFGSMEVHCADAYMIDKFLQDTFNQLTDEYRGSVKNRIRLALETLAAVVERFGQRRTGMPISPRRKSFSVITDGITT
ncbi:NADH oxidase family domain-containing protein [Trichoderma afarasin]